MGTFDLFKLWTSHSLTVPIILLISCHFLLRYWFSYWQRKGVPSLKGVFPFGSLFDIITLRKSMSCHFYDMYYKMEGEKYFGYYALLTPGIVLRDLDLIRKVLVKDFSCFDSRGVYYNEEEDPCSAHLFSLEGPKWKRLRTKLSPTYTSGKLKTMYETMMACTTQLGNYVDDISKKSEVIDIKSALQMYGVNVIAVTAIGIEGHNMREDSQFSQMTVKVTEPNIVQGYRFFLTMICKSLASRLRVRLTPVEVGDYFVNIIQQIVNDRERNNKTRNDFMQLLIELKNSKRLDSVDKSTGEGKENLTLREMVAQAFLFIIAGYETSTSTSSFALYELAMHPKIQDKLIEEIDAAKSDLTYEKLQELPYLDMVVNETLRKNPPVGFLQRECAVNYNLNGEVKLEKGTPILIPVKAFHHDPRYFPEPEKFDPERFNKSCPTHEIQPYTYMPFGEGPRFCIGMRFAKLQVKLALFILLSKFTFEISPKTVIPPKIDKKTFILNPAGGMWLRVVERKKV